MCQPATASCLAHPFQCAGRELPGITEIYLRDCLAEPLRLPGRITNVSPDGQIKVRFLPLGETVAELIEKLAFRRHRRQIAGARQPRGPGGGGRARS